MFSYLPVPHLVHLEGNLPWHLTAHRRENKLWKATVLLEFCSIIGGR